LVVAALLTPFTIASKQLVAGCLSGLIIAMLQPGVKKNENEKQKRSPIPKIRNRGAPDFLYPGGYLA
jgi:hypothetical protein